MSENRHINAQEVGRRLAELRKGENPKQKKFKQKEVAEIIGVAESTCNAWEVGRRKKSNKDGESTRPEKEFIDISNAHLCALADLYGVSVDYILGRTDYRTINGEEIAKITGLSDHAIDILQWYSCPDDPMQYHIARDVSRLVSWLVSDWDAQGGNSILQALEMYIQTPDGASGTATPETGAPFDFVNAVNVDINAVYLMQITAACVRYKESLKMKNFPRVRTD